MRVICGCSVIFPSRYKIDNLMILGNILELPFIFTGTHSGKLANPGAKLHSFVTGTMAYDSIGATFVTGNCEEIEFEL